MAISISLSLCIYVCITQRINDFNEIFPMIKMDKLHTILIKIYTLVILRSLPQTYHVFFCLNG